MDNSTETKNLQSSKLRELFQYVDNNHANVADGLREAVAIPCLSWNEKYFPEITKMLRLCEAKLNDLGATTELVEGKNTAGTSNVSTLPPILLGHLYIDEGLKTICVYGHVDTPSTTSFDEDVATKESLELLVKNGRIRGLGVSRGKGPLFAWLNALRIHVLAGIEIPVNVKFVIEGNADLHSPTLEDVVSRRSDFFRDVDYSCLTVDKKICEIPCLRYGYRGVCHFSLDVWCGPSDLDSAEYGGAFDQPLLDAVRVVSSLVDKHDKLALPNVLKDVVAPSLREKDAIDMFALNVSEVKKKIGVKRLRHKEIASRLVIHNTRLPCVTVHAFETSTDHSDAANLAITPCRAVTKFSISLVNDQKAHDTRVHVENHVKNLWTRYKAVNEYELKTDACVDPWKEDPTNPHYTAAANAIKLVYGQEPLCICDGRSLAAASILQSAYPRCNSLVLSLGVQPIGTVNFREPDAAKEDSVSVEDYSRNVKLIMAYMCYVREL